MEDVRKPEMITDPDVYFAKGCGRCARFDTPACSAMKWAKGQAALRALCLEAGLDETAKWGHPCYMHAGRNIVIMGAFQDNFRLSFFQPGLMKDPEHVLERQGENTRHADMIRFESDAAVGEKADIIRAYLKEAMGYAEKGIKAPKDTSELDLPDELVSAMDDDPELAEAFAGLTRGRQKSYVIAIGGAKQSETRANRVAKYRDKIIAGKGAMDR